MFRTMTDDISSDQDKRKGSSRDHSFKRIKLHRQKLHKTFGNNVSSSREKKMQSHCRL